VRVMEAFQGAALSGLVADKKLTIEQLRKLKSGRMAMVAGSWATPSGEGYSNADWWVPGHAYTVMAFDEDAQTVTLRNPWAQNLIRMVSSSSPWRPSSMRTSLTHTPNKAVSRSSRQP